MKTMYLAGGCFWGVEAYMKLQPGILDSEVGYANGKTQYPSYEDVCHHASGHAETVRVQYDEKVISTTKLLKIFFGIIDPTTKHRQGPDVGSQYRSGIYYEDEEDVACIQSIMQEVQKEYEESLVVEVLPIQQFYEAEEYHQDYLDKHPNGYCHINLAKAKDSI